MNKLRKIYGTHPWPRFITQKASLLKRIWVPLKKGAAATNTVLIFALIIMGLLLWKSTATAKKPKTGCCESASGCQSDIGEDSCDGLFYEDKKYECCPDLNKCYKPEKTKKGCCSYDTGCQAPDKGIDPEYCTSCLQGDFSNYRHCTDDAGCVECIEDDDCKKNKICRNNSCANLIKLISFIAADCDGHILAEWETASEFNNAGFNLYCSELEDGEYNKINDRLIIAKGNATQGAEYSYSDITAVPGVTYYYMVEDIDIYGESTFHSPVAASIPIVSSNSNYQSQYFTHLNNWFLLDSAIWRPFIDQSFYLFSPLYLYPMSLDYRCLLSNKPILENPASLREDFWPFLYTSRIFNISDIFKDY